MVSCMYCTYALTFVGVMCIMFLYFYGSRQCWWLLTKFYLLYGLGVVVEWATELGERCKFTEEGARVFVQEGRVSTCES